MNKPAFLYFVPAAGTLNEALGLVGDDEGLRGRLDGAPHVYCSEGPGGEAGLVIAGGAGVRCGYFPDAPGTSDDDDASASRLAGQSWTPAGDIWVGWEKDRKPGPVDLARDEQVDGYFVGLGDGCDWRVPLVVEFPRGSCLPKDLLRAPDGSWLTVVKPEHRAVFGEVFDLKSSIGENDGHIEDMDAALDLCVRLVGLNYDVGFVEANALGLLDTGTYKEVLRAAFDERRIEHYLSVKKKRGEVSPFDTSIWIDGFVDGFRTFARA